jgi:hypothetical protein
MIDPELLPYQGNGETGLILKRPHSVRILGCQLNAIGNRLKQIAVNHPASHKWVHISIFWKLSPDVGNKDLSLYSPEERYFHCLSGCDHASQMLVPVKNPALVIANNQIHIYSLGLPPVGLVFVIIVVPNELGERFIDAVPIQSFSWPPVEDPLRSHPLGPTWSLGDSPKHVFVRLSTPPIHREVSESLLAWCS